MQIRYLNLLVLVDLVRVECISTTTCERVLCIQALTKTQVRNKFVSKNLEVMLRIALRGQMRNLIISLKRQFLYEKIEPNMSSYILTLHVICLLEVTLIDQEFRL